MPEVKQICSRQQLKGTATAVANFWAMRKCQAFFVSLSLCVCVFSFLYQQPVLVDFFLYTLYSIYMYMLYARLQWTVRARSCSRPAFLCGMLWAGAELAGLCFWPVLSRLTCGMSKSGQDRQVAWTGPGTETGVPNTKRYCVAFPSRANSLFSRL